MKAFWMIQCFHICSHQINLLHQWKKNVDVITWKLEVFDSVGLPVFLAKRGISKTEKHAAITPETSSCDTVTLFASFGMHGHYVNITDTCPVRHFRRLWRLDASAPWNDLSIFFPSERRPVFVDFLGDTGIFHHNKRRNGFLDDEFVQGWSLWNKKIQWCRVRSSEFAHNSAGETLSNVYFTLSEGLGCSTMMRGDRKNESSLADVQVEARKL